MPRKREKDREREREGGREGGRRENKQKERKDNHIPKRRHGFPKASNLLRMNVNMANTCAQTLRQRPLNSSLAF